MICENHTLCLIIVDVICGNNELYLIVEDIIWCYGLHCENNG
jgi:hypothetical protein